MDLVHLSIGLSVCSAEQAKHNRPSLSAKPGVSITVSTGGRGHSYCCACFPHCQTSTKLSSIICLDRPLVDWKSVMKDLYLCKLCPNDSGFEKLLGIPHLHILVTTQPLQWLHRHPSAGQIADCLGLLAPVPLFCWTMPSAVGTHFTILSSTFLFRSEKYEYGGKRRHKTYKNVRTSEGVIACVLVDLGICWTHWG